MVHDITFRYAYVTNDDLCSLETLRGESLIVIRGPRGTSLEVPDPDEGMSGGNRRYEIHLKSTNGAIEVILLENKQNKWNVDDGDRGSGAQQRALGHPGGASTSSDAILDDPYRQSGARRGLPMHDAQVGMPGAEFDAEAFPHLLLDDVHQSIQPLTYVPTTDGGLVTSVTRDNEGLSDFFGIYEMDAFDFGAAPSDLE